MPKKGEHLMAGDQVQLGRRSALGLGLGIGLTALSRLARAQTVLNVTVYGGSFEDGWRKAVIEPFEKANPGIKVNISQGLTFQAAALMRAQKDDVKVDVVMMDEVAATEVAAEGLSVPLSEQTVPNLTGLYPEFRVAGYGYTKVGFSSLIIAYNSQKVTPAPKSWADFWEPRFSGKIAIPNIDTATGLLFFLAVNELNGGSLDNVEPGFAAMTKLKAGVVAFTEQHAQIAQLLTEGDIIMIPWASDRAVGLEKTGVPVSALIPKEGSFIGEQTLSIAKDTKQLDAALAYVNFAISPEAQSGNAKYTFISPVSSQAVLEPETALLVPNGAAAVKLLRRPDWKPVNERRAQWIERWNREITQ
jgi:putative spermidine/putrescine transport system substrate-binding protein